MNPNQYKRKHRSVRVDDRIRRQIATEAARRLLASLGADEALNNATSADFYTAKRKAAAVLGHAVRPGDLPSDSEVREQVVALDRQSGGPRFNDSPEPDEGDLVHISEHLDRFAIYKLRLVPLEAVKQDPKYHPEGDALYHSLQVFELAREARPYDEEFLLAALLHDVGKAIDPRDHVGTGLQSLHGTLTERASWLIEHHMDLMPKAVRLLRPDARGELVQSPYYEDLVLLRELDDAGRAIGVPVGTIDEALEYIRGLEGEAYLDENESESEALA